MRLYREHTLGFKNIIIFLQICFCIRSLLIKIIRKVIEYQYFIKLIYEFSEIGQLKKVKII